MSRLSARGRTVRGVRYLVRFDGWQAFEEHNVLRSSMPRRSKRAGAPRITPSLCLATQTSSRHPFTVSEHKIEIGPREEYPRHKPPEAPLVLVFDVF